MSIEMTDDSASVVETEERPTTVVQTHAQKASIVEEEERAPQIAPLETA